MARGGNKQDRALLLGTNALVADVERLLLSSPSLAAVYLASPEMPEVEDSTARQRRLDLLDRGVVRALAELLAEAAPSVVAVLAASRSPVTPTRHGRYDVTIARAVASALRLWKQRGGRPRRLVVLSSTAVYGIARSSPLLFDEGHPTGGSAGIDPGSLYGRWVHELREAERTFVDAAVEIDCDLLLLRSAPVAGGPVASQITDYLAAAVPVRIAGYDPPVQLVHYQDLVRAVARSIEEGVTGTLNLVGRGVAPLSRVAALAGKLVAPVPASVAALVAPDALGLAPLRGRCVADGSRALRLLGLSPKYTTEEAVGD